jgi:hypothetical protein
MNEWVIRYRKPQPEPDMEILEESALAMAQATIQNAINASGISRSELARRMNRPRSFVTRMLSGDHNLTVKTMSRALAACGYELRFGYEPIYWGWSEDDHQLYSTTLSRRTGGAGVGAPRPTSDANTAVPALAA